MEFRVLTSQESITMLVITRKPNEFVLIYIMQTRALFAIMACTQSGGGTRFRVGLDFPMEYGIVRKEHTQFKDYTFSQMKGVALGTILEM